MFIKLLTNVVNASSHTKCVSLNNQQCMIQPILNNLQSNEYSQGLRCYPFAFASNLDRCVVILLMTYLIEYILQIKQKI